MRKFSLLLLTLTFGLMAISFATSGGFAPHGAMSKALGVSGAELKSDDDSPMKFEKLTHDFGSIEQNQPVSCTFVFTNESGEAMIITKVKPGCGCTATDYPQEAIQPGETASITATYNPKSMGKFRKSIIVNTNVPYGEAILYISGEVK
ncbi:MAG: DUF1573 domain-containing protein [Flavobacteriales bacterium]|nr:DUF1573 domain-containing protein [Flavobacteriales bacterium]